MVFGLKHLSWVLTKLRILPNSSKRSITFIKLFVRLLNCSLIYAILLNGEVNAAPIYLILEILKLKVTQGIALY